MTIGQKIIQNVLLTVEEATEVHNDLETLEKEGTWIHPGWAKELQEHFKIPDRDKGGIIPISWKSVILVSWRAVAKAYFESLC